MSPSALGVPWRTRSLLGTRRSRSLLGTRRSRSRRSAPPPSPNHPQTPHVHDERVQVLVVSLTLLRSSTNSRKVEGGVLAVGVAYLDVVMKYLHSSSSSRNSMTAHLRRRVRQQHVRHTEHGLTSSFFGQHSTPNSQFMATTQQPSTQNRLFSLYMTSRTLPSPDPRGLPEDFPLKPKMCDAVATAFFTCFTEDVSACATQLRAYEQCLAKWRRRNPPELYRVPEEYRS